jgi:hypothetical protein
LRDFARHSRDFARRSHGPVKKFVSRVARSGVEKSRGIARATLRGVGRGLQGVGGFLENAGVEEVKECYKPPLTAPFLDAALEGEGNFYGRNASNELLFQIESQQLIDNLDQINNELFRIDNLIRDKINRIQIEDLERKRESLYQHELYLEGQLENLKNVLYLTRRESGYMY